MGKSRSRDRSSAHAEEEAVRELRDLLRGGGPSERLGRLERMERVARIWVNGDALGAAAPNGHLYETYD